MKRKRGNGLAILIGLCLLGSSGCRNGRNASQFEYSCTYAKTIEVEEINQAAPPEERLNIFEVILPKQVKQPLLVDTDRIVFEPSQQNKDRVLVTVSVPGFGAGPAKEFTRGALSLQAEFGTSAGDNEKRSKLNWKLSCRLLASE